MASFRIQEEEYKRRVIQIMEIIIPKNSGETHELNELFQLHNDRFDPHESGIFCSGCVSRVARKMKEYYYTIKTDV